MGLHIISSDKDNEEPKSGKFIEVDYSIGSKTTLADYRAQYDNASNNDVLGYRAATKVTCATIDFQIWLKKIYNAFIVEQSGKDNNRLNKIDEHKSDITSSEAKIEHNLKRIEGVKEKIHDLNSQIQAVKDESKDKLGLSIGVFILISLTFYLWLFYSSAIYSAIFRVIDPGTELFTTIFYPKAIVSAFNQDIFEGLLILFAPFIFIGLGYLIHKFSEEKKTSNYLKMISLLIITFVFDGIIAFEITKKIYDANNLIAANPLPAYSVGIAFSEINFWMIIFAGFIVYIVWGLILSFVLNETNPENKKKRQIRFLKDQRRDKENDIEAIEKEILDLKNHIIRLKQIISNLLNKVSIDLTEVTKILQEFASGWYRCIEGGQYLNKEECSNKLDEFIIKLNS